MVVESGSNNNPIIIPDSPEPPSPVTIRCFQCQSVDHVHPIATSTYVHSVNESPLDILSRCAPCVPAQSVESLVMRVPVAQLQPRLAHHLSLPEWVTWDDLESEPQGYKGGNVTVVGTPTPLSPFSLADCTLYSHFSFNDFVAIAFLDSTKDLDTQI